MLIIIHKVVGSNAWDYPENPKYFTNSFSNPSDNEQLVVENNSGKTLAELSANVPYTVVEYNNGSIEFTITNITGDISHEPDFSKVNALELVDLILTGTVAIPDTTFIFYLTRDDGRLFLFPADIIAGAFNLSINFPSLGKFTLSDHEINMDAENNIFTVNTLTLNILRNSVIVKQISQIHGRGNPNRP